MHPDPFLCSSGSEGNTTGMAATASPLGTGQPASLSQTIYDVEPVRLHGVSVRGTEESRGPMAEEENEGPGAARALG